MTLLRKRHKRVFDFIEECIALNGEAPTLAEIAKHFGWKSNSTVHDILVRLEDAALIRRTPKVSRGIQLPVKISDTEPLRLVALEDLPTLAAARKSVIAGAPNALETFIAAYGPVTQPSNAALFQTRLLEALNYVRSNNL